MHVYLIAVKYTGWVNLDTLIGICIFCDDCRSLEGSKVIGFNNDQYILLLFVFNRFHINKIHFISLF